MASVPTCLMFLDSVLTWTATPGQWISLLTTPSLSLGLGLDRCINAVCCWLNIALKKHISTKKALSIVHSVIHMKCNLTYWRKFFWLSVVGADNFLSELHILGSNCLLNVQSFTSGNTFKSCNTLFWKLYWYWANVSNTS